MVSGRTLVNAVIGAVVAVVFSFIPFSTILGGAAAGFLEGSDGRDGAISGALSGLIMFLPMAGIAMFFAVIFGVGFGVAGMPASGAAVGLLFLGIVAGGFFVYVVGLSVFGGLLGAYLAREYPEQHASARETIGYENAPRDSSRSSEGEYATTSTRSETDEAPLEDDGFGPSDGDRVDDHESDSYWDRDRPPINTDTDDDRVGNRRDSGRPNDEVDSRDDDDGRFDT
ncbi:DUF5518 domain-containing protein [Halostagnicola sp. A-GB9-2]|uniref:DUF5518 domain-containing protein n=1 Tax=Halostagnicola sp. A-GB9-2 TaxID=3048066 RepID=UPI0024BF35EB|nr:DUF5518 domain-containing protein [Halostagnicola sp. A-GB9-2]MDJ1432773.1 DUF5518 domain-containing protein [Halostagnicola sp. A-GB9-2]